MKKLFFIFHINWCGREESNFHSLARTGVWVLRVYQFRHVRVGIIDNTNLSAKVQEVSFILQICYI
jgi:hypothetical protein